jgi:hypothetical protein
MISTDDVNSLEFLFIDNACLDQTLCLSARNDIDLDIKTWKACADDNRLKTRIRQELTNKEVKNETDLMAYQVKPDGCRVINDHNVARPLIGPLLLK